MNLLTHSRFNYCHKVCRLIYLSVLLLYSASGNSHEGVKHVHSVLAPATTEYKKVITPSSEHGSINIVVRDTDKTPTPAFISVKYADSWQYVVLEQPFLPNPRLTLQRSYRPQWKTKFPIHTTGSTHLSLPVGKYQLLVGKGIEYTPQTIDFTIQRHTVETIDITLERLVNMPELGWWSGDPHVHAPRFSAKDNRELLWAAQAEDIHVSSILTMGDANNLHFPQYAMGDKGKVQDNDFWLVPGQEEPRTSELGHTIFLNTQELYRNTQDYYRYDIIFRQARADGALTGIAHFFGDKFYSRNAGALLLAEGLVDFVELLDDNGLFKPKHYYDALNMGARLSLTAGSDFPWGGHIGDNRTYAFLGKGNKLTPTKWYEAIKSGRTFITQGPIISFLINGETIGSELNINKGDELVITAQAQGHASIGIPKNLSLISMGDVIHKVEIEKHHNPVLGFTLGLKADKNRWFVIETIAHNGAVAHSSPIYINVDNSVSAVSPKQLLALYQQNIARIEQLTSAEFVPEDQRENFISWLKKITLIYKEKIKSLETLQSGDS